LWWLLFLVGVIWVLMTRAHGMLQISLNLTAYDANTTLPLTVQSGSIVAGASLSAQSGATNTPVMLSSW
jgi:hypothetical protein